MGIGMGRKNGMSSGKEKISHKESDGYGREGSYPKRKEPIKEKKTRGKEAQPMMDENISYHLRDEIHRKGISNTKIPKKSTLSIRRKSCYQNANIFLGSGECDFHGKSGKRKTLRR